MRRFLALLAVLTLGATPARAAPAITTHLASAVKDLRASATLAQANLAALKKIGDDYANAYRAKTMEVYFKEPGKIRFEMKALGITFTYTINGNTKYSSVPQLRLRQTTDISNRPQTRQNSMEIGFLTASALRDYDAQYLRAEGALLLYELRFQQKDLRQKKIVLWVDPAKKLLVRREIYHDDGTLKARFSYLNPKEVAPGIWMPTRITVHNGAGELGGTTHYGNFRVNTGLPDSLFEGA